MEFYSLTIHELHDKLIKGETTSEEITESVLGRIRAVDDKVKAYITITEDIARVQAQEADKRIKAGDTSSPVLGIPLAVKDNMCTDGIRTTCASKMLRNFVPPYDATVVQILKGAGYVLCGKPNMDEFAMGSSTENSGFFITKNPWDLERIPGGSSGGSAAAVAAGECIGSLGSDTGGSIRQPASCCGVVGLKPTYGRVSRYGLVAYASSLDQIGTITKDVTDAALLLNVISGHDVKDSTSANIPSPDFTKALRKDVEGMTIGLPKEYFIEGMDPEVEKSIKGAVKTLEGLGAKVVEVSLPHTDYAVATYYILATSEASSNLARYDGVKYGFRTQAPKDLMDMYMKTRDQGFGAEVKRRIMLGTYALSAGYYDAYYKKSQQVRTLIKRDFDEAFKTVDIIATPTAPTAAFKIGEKSSDPLQMYLSDIFTISVNLAGIPGISIPCGFTSGNMPIGLQLLGKHFNEESILHAAFAYEQTTEWHKRRPKL
ncbi:MAG TPA: Asp-tRNA(Asn)/Glu-tRNA(Gln) amidotransferase subunit GatA [Nitrospirota bacterium]|nr:Asp-tRNA(Asn)/Glu-tRNA(Gln) amidotransferase subunit GatA [Nitrospirota bacterium]